MANETGTERIVCDGGGERAALQAEAPDEADPDLPGGVVALHHGDLREVARRVGHDRAVAHRRLELERVRDQLLRHDLDHADG
jgi:hypothetical protein